MKLKLNFNIDIPTEDWSKAVSIANECLNDFLTHNYTDCAYRNKMHAIFFKRNKTGSISIWVQKEKE